MLVDEEGERREHQVADDECYRREDDPAASEVDESNDYQSHGRDTQDERAPAGPGDRARHEGWSENVKQPSRVSSPRETG
jgi:hypothetical protein